MFLSNCKRDFPATELCILGDAGCICNDPRKPIGQQDYVLPYPQCINYVATSPESFQLVQEWELKHCK